MSNKLIVIFSFLVSSQSWSQTCSPSGKYSNCNEQMPKDLLTFTDSSCTSQGISAGKECLNAYERWFEDKLKSSKPSDYSKFMAAKSMQDSGDSQACLRYLNGVFKRARGEFLDRTAQLSKFIKDTAAYYGVPAEAIVCAIGGDATTTSGSYPDQSRYDDPMIQSTPVSEAQRDLGSKNLKFGNPPTPITGISPAPSSAEIQSIRDAALILRHDLEIYKDAGFSDTDLSPEILASIYHMGAYRGSPRENWAAKTMREGRKPGLSFIGLFCARYKEIPFKLKLGI